MYLKLFFLALISFTVNFTYGQNRYAKFIDGQTGKGIAYCTLTSFSGKNGGFADSLGLLRLYNLNNIDSIKISALGYNEVIGSLKAPDFVKRDTIFFILFQKEIQLEEVKIISCLTKRKTRNEIGYFKKNENLVRSTA